jgi:uroporphyrinogen decarboxylase
MKPRQRVLTALEHRSPDRVPFSWNFGPTPEMRRHLVEFLSGAGLEWRALRRETEDILTMTPFYTGPPLPPWVDVWGIRRKPVSYGAGHYLEFEWHPLAGVEDPRALDDHPWPHASPYGYEALRERILRADPDGRRAKKLCVTACGNPFETYCWMTGLEEAMTNLIANPELVHAALDRICTHFEEKMRLAVAALPGLVDLFYFADDLGSQTGLLVSRDTYRSMIQPYHARLVRTAASLVPGAKAMLHSDGAVFDVLPDVIDAGFAVFEAVQVDAVGMQPQALKEVYGERLCFHGGISVQQLLPSSNAERVTAECRRLVEEFGERGGYVAAPSHAIQVGTPPENVLAMLRGVLGDEDYESALEAARPR